MLAADTLREGGSFRDPAGFVFLRDGVAYRQVNEPFADEYRRFMRSGLYDELVRERLLVPHHEVDPRTGRDPGAHAVLLPEQIPFISYPYEWCFGQLKAAALLTLEIQRRALDRGLQLRDASAFNVQFMGTRAIFIDTLSFGEYVEGRPWLAYRQFCQHFLAPLALMSLVEPSLGQLSGTYLDGVPLALTSGLLPMRSRLKPGLLVHLHMHERSERRARSAPDCGDVAKDRGPAISRAAMLGLVDSLQRTVAALSLPARTTVWSTYESHLNYTAAAQETKRQMVKEMLLRIGAASRVETVWDVGANSGEYSRIAATLAPRVIAFDADHAVVDRHFVEAAARHDGRVLPLVQNFANPSPALGWHHAERQSLVDRGPADVVLALALVHHLVIGGNVPLAAVAAFFHAIGRHLVVEFVPKDDSQVRRMLALRGDTFSEYSQQHFEQAFLQHFRIVQSLGIDGTVRRVYLMARR